MQTPWVDPSQRRAVALALAARMRAAGRLWDAEVTERECDTVPTLATLAALTSLCETLERHPLAPAEAEAELARARSGL